MSEPKNQMEALIRTIEARGKVYWDHTEIDNKALDDVQTVFDFEVKKLEEENRRLKIFKSNALYCFKKICQVGLNRRDCAELASNIIDMDFSGELYEKEQGDE